MSGINARPDEAAFPDGLCREVGCVAQATHAVWVWGEGADLLCGRERVRRLGATHSTYGTETYFMETYFSDGLKAA